jgi:hypothetical protein
VIYTGKAVDAMLKRHAVALATQYAAAIEALTPEDCDPPHRDRPSCPVCSARRTVQAAAAVIRETSDKQQRGDGRNG